MMTAQIAAQHASSSHRIAWLDVARGYGMFLVWYGHLVERFAMLALPGAFAQYKFIYSFHMPLFFVIAGLLAPPRPGVIWTLKRGMFTRILPAVSFNLLLVPIVLPPSPWADAPLSQQVGSNLLKLVLGQPIFNFLTWFLFCLFVVEVLHAILRRVIQRNGAIAASILMLFVVGQLVARNLELIRQWTGISDNVWMMDEALVALAFHQVGYLAARGRLLHWRPTRALLVAACALCWFGVASTFDLNRGPFHPDAEVVLMSISRHGNPVLFPITALLGAGGIASLAMLSPNLAPARWIGQSSLFFLGLNGIFFLANPFIAPRLFPYMPEQLAPEVLALSGMTVASLAMAAPLAMGLMRWLPQLFGKPPATADSQQLNWLRGLAVLVIVAAVIEVQGWTGPDADPLNFNRGSDRLYLEGNQKLGRFLAQERPADTLIAVSAGGVIPYLSGLPTLDLYGRTDRHIARQRFPEPRTYTGHLKWDSQYALGRQPSLFVPHHGYFRAGDPKADDVLAKPFSLAKDAMERDLFGHLVWNKDYALRPIRFADGSKFFVFERTAPRDPVADLLVDLP